jgi:hypothetical protein
LTALDYEIVVPSRNRVANMGRIRQLLPTAKVCVDEREVREYTKVVPKDHLIAHPGLVGLPTIHNWLIEEIKAPILIRIDDDLRWIISNTGSRRHITDAQEILAVIENAARACFDLGLGVFCFSRAANTTIVRPEEKPIVPTQVAASAFGIMNAARYRKFDPKLHGRADVDFSLQTLLDDRVLYADIRFYFDFGPIGYGSGGSAGMISRKDYQTVSRLLALKWGSSLKHGGPAFVKNRTSESMSLAVKRTNPRAQK